MLTDDELEAITSRHAAATPGPWEYDADALDPSIFRRKWPGDHVACLDSCAPDDSVFIAAAWDDVRALLAEVERLRQTAGWQPIETAPKASDPPRHRRRILLSYGSSSARYLTFGHYVDDPHLNDSRPYWDGDDVPISCRDQPTHWMYVPPPPIPDVVPGDAERPPPP